MEELYLQTSHTQETKVGISCSQWILFCPQLPNEEEPEEGAQVASDPPPPYSSIAADSAGMQHL